MKRFGESDVLYPTSILPFSLLTELQLYSGVHPSPHRLGLQRRVTHPCLEMDLPGLSPSQSLGHLPMTGLGMSMWHNSGHRDMRGSVLGELLAKLLILERIPRKSWFLPLLDADVIGYDSRTAATTLWPWEGEMRLQAYQTRGHLGNGRAQRQKDLNPNNFPKPHTHSSLELPTLEILGV